MHFVSLSGDRRAGDTDVLFCPKGPKQINTSFSALPWAEPFLSPALSICRMIPGLGHGPSATQEPHKKQRAEAWDGVYPSANHKQQLFLLEWPKNLKRRKGPHFVLAPLMLSW